MHEFTIGNVVRVVLDRPDGTPLRRGALVTIKTLGVAPGPTGVGQAYAIVTPGEHRVRLRSIEPVSFASVVHGTALDIEEQEMFDEIVDLDPLLRGWASMTAEQVSEGFTERTTVREEPPAAVGTLPRVETHHEPADINEVADDRVFSFEDEAEDMLDVIYLDRECGDHGYEGVFRFQIDEECEVDVPLDEVGPLLMYLRKWVMHYTDERKKRR